ncbi:hypothetical protein ANCCAN_17502 [Ancylostoma caninum]|uniref:Uncharacterized protein n=1 Tax=Ancylostoma caninum TaxID=29170 RepID=A0A368FWN9_ANCCA|nr:hypothetical protein ANCCAN_17502 [Ancylostoma caninum]
MDASNVNCSNFKRFLRNSTALLLSVVGAYASTLEFIIIITVLMWNKIQRRIDVREIKSMAGKQIIKKKKKLSKEGKSKEGSAEGTKSAEGEDKAGKQKATIGSAGTGRTKQSGSKENKLPGSGEKGHDGGDGGTPGLEPSQEPVFTGGGTGVDPYTGAAVI